MGAAQKQKVRRLGPDDKGIADRLRRVRAIEGLSQSAFAGEIGIEKNRLGSYEEARVRLRWDIALRICRRFIISEKWLATGAGNTRQYLNVRADDLGHTPPPDAAFSTAYREFISEEYERRLERFKDSALFYFAPGEARGFYGVFFRAFVEVWIRELDPELQPGFFRHLFGKAEAFLTDASARTAAVEDVEARLRAGSEFFVIPLWAISKGQPPKHP